MKHTNFGDGVLRVPNRHFALPTDCDRVMENVDTLVVGT
jgi:hypothetical protein